MTIQDQLPVTDAKPPPVAAVKRTPTVSTEAVLDALINHYRKPGEDRSGEILITEPSAPGSTRRCDLLRVGMWASRGTGIDVHEIKVSRSDWLRELDDPAKAEAWWPYCNRFWITAPPGIIVPAELPEGWGLMELPSSGRRFKVKVAAGSKVPKLTTALMVELLRRADNQRLGEMDTLRSRHRDEMYQADRQRELKQAQTAIPYEVKRRLELLEKVEAAIGMPLDEFGGWPKYPPAKIAPEELAALLMDARDHVTVQRRAAEVARVESGLRQSAETTLKQLRRISSEGAA